MVSIGEFPILIHIMNLYAKYGHKEFIVATGYKADIIQTYFQENSNHFELKSDKQIDYNFSIKFGNNKDNWKVTLLFTGENTMTGGRVKQAQGIIDDESFFMTYGDGLSDININNLHHHHEQNNKIATLTAVRPPVRFGEIKLEGDNVISFEEKPKLQKGWINGGFFVLNRNVFDFIDGDETMFERAPLESLVKLNQLTAYRHEDFWQCMDTKRDRDLLEELWISKKFPW